MSCGVVTAAISSLFRKDQSGYAAGPLTSNDIALIVVGYELAPKGFLHDNTIIILL